MTTMPNCAHCPYPLAASEVYTGHTVCERCRAMTRSITAGWIPRLAGFAYRPDLDELPGAIFVPGGDAHA